MVSHDAQKNLVEAFPCASFVGMKTAVTQDLALQSSAILAWLHAGETVMLVEDGQPLGRIVPEKRTSAAQPASRRELFARRFAPLSTVPSRDLSDIVNDNRGEA
jgi:antitoxin (DNA-binding transcriptional repressor) of toxin-antitoxin stability system